MHEHTFIVSEDSNPDRVDKILAAHYPEVSRATIQRFIESGKICRKNGDRLEPKKKLHPGEILLVDLSPVPIVGLRPVDLPIGILYEDESLIVVDKPSGMVVHPGDGTGEDTLVHALLHHCGEKLSSVGAPVRPGIVHRLDKDTSGAIVVAKTDPVHHALVKQFADRETGKKYLALVSGVPREKFGSVTLPIGRHPTIRVKMAAVGNGKPAHTDWERVNGFGDLASLLRCSIHTGRTHQIRVHLSSLGHPVVGDETYGFKPARSRIPSPPRVLLHAQKLSFTHPASGELMNVEAPVPTDFSDYLKLLK
jgi:23S rRNA pseudouridine1911/1915/1917 synthase